MCNFALFNDDIIGVRGTWLSLHYVRLGIVSPVGTDGRPPTRMGWSENRERERERERIYFQGKSSVLSINKAAIAKEDDRDTLPPFTGLHCPN